MEAGGAPLPTSPTGVNPLADVERFLSSIEVPSNDRSQSVPLSQVFTSTAPSGSTERVNGMITRLADLYKGSIKACDDELASAQRHSQQARDDAERTIASAEETAALLNRASTTAREMQGGATGQEQVDDLSETVADADRANDGTADGAADTLHQIGQGERDVAAARQESAAATSSAAAERGSHSGDADWVKAIDNSIVEGTVGSFTTADLVTFVPDVGTKPEYATQLSVLKTGAADLLDNLKDLQNAAVARATAYRTWSGLREGQDDDVSLLMTRMASSLRGMHTLVSGIDSSKPPRWTQYKAPLSDIVMPTIIMLEYRLQFFMANAGEESVRPLPNGYDVENALAWPTKLQELVDGKPALGSPVPTATAKVWTRAKEAFDKVWHTRVVSP